MQFSQVLGFVGTALVVVAYFPQIMHLVKEHCSAGISRYAYVLWGISGVFLLIHALMIHDNVFVILQGWNSVASFLIVGYSMRYRYGICESHRLPR